MISEHPAHAGRNRVELPVRKAKDPVTAATPAGLLGRQTVARRTSRKAVLRGGVLGPMPAGRSRTGRRILGQINTFTSDHAGSEPPAWRRGWARHLDAWTRTSVTALVYTALMVLGETLLNTRSPAVRSQWLDWSTTSLANLHAHPLGSLAVSGFLPDGDLADWIALSMIGLVVAGHVLGNVRLAVLAAVSHVAATLVSQGVLAYRLRIGTPGAAADAQVLDVGPSYLVVPALVVGMAYGSWPARIASGIAFFALAPHLFGGLSQLDVAPVGHCCAIVIGLALGYPFSRQQARRSSGPHRGSPAS
jgi:hypothetical protein